MVALIDKGHKDIKMVEKENDLKKES